MQQRIDYRSHWHHRWNSPHPELRLGSIVGAEVEVAPPSQRLFSEDQPNLAGCQSLVAAPTSLPGVVGLLPAEFRAAGEVSIHDTAAVVVEAVAEPWTTTCALLMAG